MSTLRCRTKYMYRLAYSSAYQPCQAYRDQQAHARYNSAKTSAIIMQYADASYRWWA